MAATSVTGRGHGDSNKPTVKDLAILANGPQIVCAGWTTSVDRNTSPESAGGTVVFPRPLPGTSVNYVITLGTLNAGAAYVSLVNDDDDTFTGFEYICDQEASIMYQVCSIGFKPEI